MKNWISVKDRLPEIGRFLTKNRFGAEKECFFDEDGSWIYDGIEVRVTHWNPTNDSN